MNKIKKFKNTCQNGSSSKSIMPGFPSGIFHNNYKQSNVHVRTIQTYVNKSNVQVVIFTLSSLRPLHHTRGSSSAGMDGRDR